MVSRHYQKLTHVFQAQIDTQPGQRVHDPHGVTHHQHARVGDTAFDALLNEREGQALIDLQHFTEAMLNGVADVFAERVGCRRFAPLRRRR